MLSKALIKVLYAFDKGYRVDEEGNVISPFTGKHRKLQKHYKGNYIRLSFTVAINGTSNKYAVNVHQLAAYQKFGKSLLIEGVEVRHLDGNSLNNSLSNLALGTRQDNELDKPKELRKKISIGASTKIRKFTDVEMEHIRKFHTNSYKETMNAFNIKSSGTLHYILNTKYQTKV